MLNPDSIDFSALPEKAKGLWAMLSALTRKTGSNNFDLSGFARRNNFRVLRNDELTDSVPKCIAESGANYIIESGVELEKGTVFYFISYPLSNNGQSMQQSRWFGLLDFEINKSYGYIFALQKKFKSYEFIDRSMLKTTQELVLEGNFSNKFLVKVGSANPTQALEFLTPDVMHVLYDTSLMTSIEVTNNRVTIMCNVLGSDRESVQKFIKYCSEVQNKIIY